CIAIKALDFGKLRIGEQAAVLGGGGIGLLITQLLRSAGATRIFLSEPLDYRAEMGLRCGATAILDPADPTNDLMRKTGGRGVDVVFEATTSVTAQQQALDMARLGGRVVLIGIPPSEDITLRASVMRRKGLTITVVRRSAHVYPRAIALAQQGLVDLPLLLSHQAPLEETARIFDLMADYADGVVRAAIQVAQE
ncbi:MAG: zinc-binding dehydrogenase, partial [Chloroflexales bacterium]|nr:zinc-binding dehydrogenase [Chloroflexales bacterium]